MSKVTASVAILLGLLMLPSARGAILFQATLTGDREVPPVVTTASGSATLSLNDAQDRLEISISLSGLDLDGTQSPGTSDDNVVAAHIHLAPVGVNGPIVFGFVGPNSDTNFDLVIDPVAGTIFSAWDFFEGLGTTLTDQLANLTGNLLYINVHTLAHPGGEIRGQIFRVPEPSVLALAGFAIAVLMFCRRRSVQSPSRSAVPLH